MKAYFEGWYLKHQGKDGTLAVIPAWHVDKNGQPFASVQVVTEQETELIHYPIEEFHISRRPFSLRIGENRFYEIGCTIDFSGRKLKVKGTLKYGALLSPAHDVMGPFRFLPFLQCRHQIFSLMHRVDGKLLINERPYVIRNGFGYIEGDKGHSFPERYIWTQCTGKNFTIMLAAADVPVFGRGFTGCTGVLFYKGKEYRIATYLGGKVIYADSDYVVVEQRGYLLEAHRLCGEMEGLPLYAPEAGDMERVVRESPSCMVKYKLSKGGKKLFSFIARKASFESDWK